MVTETETPLTITMNAAIFSGSRRGEVADIVVGEPNGSFINDCENPPDFVPEEVEAVFVGFPFQGKKTMLTLAFDGSVMDATDPELTPEEREAWDELMASTRKAEASARSLRAQTEKSIEVMKQIRRDVKSSTKTN